MGFHQDFITWLMQCISTVSYSFLINEEVLGSTIPSRGIRQGDPLSPYVFIFCGEVLSGMCRKSQLDRKLAGIRVATHSPRINHLLFADDTMFFVHSDPNSCLTLKTILNDYEAASGQMINASKSSITFSAKTTPEEKLRIKKTMGIEKEGGIGKYLGLLKHFGRNKKDLFASIVDQIKQKAISLASRQLSQAGKLTMLKSILSLMPTFAMTCFELPGSLCKRIHSTLTTRFWWDPSETKKRICWVSWDKLTKPKNIEGLGFRDIQQFNRALLGKLAWRIVTKPDCLMARTLLEKYCHNKAFLKTTYSASASHGWRGVLKGRDVLIQHLGKVVGNGNSIRLWHDPWLSTSSPKAVEGPLTLDDKDLAVVDVLTRETCIWNRAALEKQFPTLLDEILLLHPSTTGAEDSYAWLQPSSGSYTTKSVYMSLQRKGALQELNARLLASFNWYRFVWNTQAFPKIQVFLWKTIQNVLPTEENLQKKVYSLTQSVLDAENKRLPCISSSIASLHNKYGTWFHGHLPFYPCRLQTLRRNSTDPATV